MSYEDRIASLYGLPLTEFTAARNALAADARAAGDKEIAREIGGLSKPNVIAWALNQVTRSHPELIDAAFEASNELREAMARRGGIQDPRVKDDYAGDDFGGFGGNGFIGNKDGPDTSGFDRASGRWKRASSRIVAAAGEFLGRTPTHDHSERIRGTLYAAALDPEIEAEVRAGRLTQHQYAYSYGFFVDAGGADLAVVPDAPPTAEDQSRYRPAVEAAERAVEAARRRAADSSQRAVRAFEESERLSARAAEAATAATSARLAAESDAIALAAAEKTLGELLKSDD